MQIVPKSRSANILQQEINEGIMIYDLDKNTAYSLNETSTIIYKYCDGKTTFEDIKKNHQFSDDLIYFALDQLNANNLLEDYDSKHFAGMSRREVIRKIGLASMVALPMISYLVAPQAAAAASCIGDRPTNSAICIPDVEECNRDAPTLCLSCTATFVSGDSRCYLTPENPSGNPVGGMCVCD